MAQFQRYVIYFAILSSVLATTVTLADEVIDGGPDLSEDISIPYSAISYPGFLASVYTVDLDSPRGLEMSPNGDLIIANRATNQILLVWDDDHQGSVDESEGERLVLATVPGRPGTAHGVLLYKGFLYASSDVSVYRWPFVVGSRQALQNMETVVDDIYNTGDPANPVGDEGAGVGYLSRALTAYNDHLYVQVGAASLDGNDVSSWRAAIRRFAIPPNTTFASPLLYKDGEVFADGLRNTVELTMDSYGVMWGADMGTDGLKNSRPDLTLDDNRNPLDELNSFDPTKTGQHYGYPRCWSAEDVRGYPRGTQFGLVKSDDTFCRNTQNNHPPRLGFHSHSGPIGLVFYTQADAEGRWGFPQEFVGDAFVAMRGSAGRPIPSGYRLVRVKFEKNAAGNGANPVSYEPFLFFNRSTADPITPQNDAHLWNRRMVDVMTGNEGELHISDDYHNVTYIVRYMGIKTDVFYLRMVTEGVDVVSLDASTLTQFVADSLDIRFERVNLTARIPDSTNSSVSLYFVILPPLEPGGEPVLRIKRNVQSGELVPDLGLAYTVTDYAVVAAEDVPQVDLPPVPARPNTTPGSSSANDNPAPTPAPSSSSSKAVRGSQAVGGTIMVAIVVVVVLLAAAGAVTVILKRRRARAQGGRHFYQQAFEMEEGNADDFRASRA
mmetsp:Transcript_7571/g.12088  ORF Transcript_7571/g.12088 Transcript_7571/m.12088 type:complete len:665 (-) Transcript_7571:1003-2997(-)|eukprot:CAMPEP_0184351400 /NCGR_PEP_ID=MMETSP1089-20130417/43601_1 /TAXON_ID=38269 ORGANISM="Gloeochaete wittrockiana, Strain SAG46.84" /NCGR_SAMPLE_ID=MMETSP1089 /ASSEMBLY_ACC=CAM_ASM_000445 /LENGTH=664 /DNA_ID=CAMNT_0026684745 /DNA_START=27 /DNA_END=2021 /DNA_ORIENTATION=-